MLPSKYLNDAQASEIAAELKKLRRQARQGKHWEIAQRRTMLGKFPLIIFYLKIFWQWGPTRKTIQTIETFCEEKS